MLPVLVGTFEHSTRLAIGCMHSEWTEGLKGISPGQNQSMGQAADLMTYEGDLKDMYPEIRCTHLVHCSVENVTQGWNATCQACKKQKGVNQGSFKVPITWLACTWPCIDCHHAVC